ncbi:MAG TPA: NHL repeat-containing protein [Steroidobacteraceae bacterium]|nr:NHL repeat-containing protein [Steroidobacteraceae bacterium]
MSKSLPGSPSRREFAIVCSLVLTLGGCGGGGGSSAASSSSDSSGGSSPTTYSLSGRISGLGAASGLVLLNNGGDATTVAANSTGFTMKTPVAAGSVYAITVGSQPYGLTLACSVSGGGGTVSGNVTSIAVSCSNATPTQKAIAGYFANPLDVAVDASGDVFVADNGDNSIREIPYSGGSYGAPITVGSGFSFPYAVATDANGNVFVADAGHDSVKEIPYNGGSYGAPLTVASGFLTPTQILQGDLCPTGVAVSPSGSVFAVCGSALDEIPFSGGSYGAPITVASSFSFPRGVALDAKGNVFVADASANAVYEVPSTGSGYGAPITLASGFNYPEGVALDAAGNVFVSDTLNQALKEIPLSDGSYGAPITVASAFGNNPSGSPLPGIAGLAADTKSNVFVADERDNAVWEVPFNGSAYGTPLAVGSGISMPAGFAVDANDNLFVADATSMSMREIPYSGGAYHTAITVAPLLADLISVTVTPNGNVIAAESTSVALTEIPFSGGVYLVPGPLSDRYGNPIDLYGEAPCLAADANDNLFFLLDTGMNDPPVQKLPFSAGYYQSPAQTIATMGIGSCSGIAVDSNQNVFVTINDVVYELPFSSGSYGAAITLNAGSGEFRGMAVDANGDVFVADSTHDVVTELPFTNGSYGTPITLGSGFNGPFSLAMGHHGQLFVADQENIWQLGP